MLISFLIVSYYIKPRALESRLQPPVREVQRRVNSQNQPPFRYPHTLTHLPLSPVYLSHLSTSHLSTSHPSTYPTRLPRPSQVLTSPIPGAPFSPDPRCYFLTRSQVLRAQPIPGAPCSPHPRCSVLTPFQVLRAHPIPGAPCSAHPRCSVLSPS